MSKCTICLSEPSRVSNAKPCEHTFCTVCIIEWTTASSKCPVCRTEIAEVHTKVAPKVFVASYSEQEFSSMGESSENDSFDEVGSESNASDEFFDTVLALQRQYDLRQRTQRTNRGRYELRQRPQVSNI